MFISRVSLRFFTLFLTVLVLFASPPTEKWGFYAHRLINRMAVYTLPPQMMILYKPHIDYLADHAVDPDKRRYASPFEAMRHYIDLEAWGEFPFESLPRHWWEAVMRHTDLKWISGVDSVLQEGSDVWNHWHAKEDLLVRLPAGQIRVPFRQMPGFYRQLIIPQFYEDVWSVPCDSLAKFLGVQSLPCLQVQVIDSLTKHGILPYHLARAQRNLTAAFVKREPRSILQLSAEIGHYIGDAHVPLHTTINYNGQLTNQVGIHAFWESRIPELFAEAQYDFLVGKPSYIDDPVRYYWDIVLSSHHYVDSVLQVEKELSRNFPEDRQYCFDERLDRTVRTQCREYARAYQQRLAGMVEAQMQASILAIASAWYTAWIDAGQPKFGYDELVTQGPPETAPTELPTSNQKRFRTKRKHE